MQHTQNERGLQLREKLVIYGAKSLSDTELLAVFISSGTRQKSCLQLANDLLFQLGDLRTILNTEWNIFNQIKGLGLTRYSQLQALKEICRRSDFINLAKKTQLHSCEQAYIFLKRQLRDNKNEVFVALFLDSQHQVISYEELFHGTINATSIHTRPLIARVMTLNAAAVIVAHNHPSGNCSASAEDIAITNHLRQALDVIEVRLLDHLVVGDNTIFSIQQDAIIPCH